MHSVKKQVSRSWCHQMKWKIWYVLDSSLNNKSCQKLLEKAGFVQGSSGRYIGPLPNDRAHRLQLIALVKRTQHLVSFSPSYLGDYLDDVQEEEPIELKFHVQN